MQHDEEALHVLLRACFVFQCTQKGQEWSASYVQEGVRPAPGQKQLSLARFSERGSPDWIGPALTFASERNISRTRRPPDGPDAWVEPWSTILIARGWLAPGGGWLGPRKGSGRGRA